MKRTCQRNVGLFLTAIGLSACDVAESSRSTTRDSLGVRIVESTQPLWEASGWTVTFSPVIDLATSGAGSAHEFFRVADATRLADGSIVVADRGSNEVRLFSAAGAHEWTAGGAGEGPGEFRNITTIVSHGAGIAAFDTRLSRLTLLTRNGHVEQVVTIGPPDGAWRRLDLLTDSTVAGIAASFGDLGEERGVFRRPHYLLRLSVENGELIDTVLAYPGDEMWELAVGGMVGIFPPLFGRSSAIAFGSRHVVVGTAESMAFQVYTHAGELVGVTRVLERDLALSPTEIADARNARMADAEGGPDVLVRALEDLPHAPTRPAYQTLLVDRDGYVWVGRYNSGLGPQPAERWDVFTDVGEWLGEVQVPARFTIFEIGSDYLLGRWTDEVDVEHVQLLRLTRN